MPHVPCIGAPVRWASGPYGPPLAHFQVSGPLLMQNFMNRFYFISSRHFPAQKDNTIEILWKIASVQVSYYSIDKF